MNRKPVSIYFHWPFCVSKCPYCDFNSHIQRNIDQKEWGQALKTELNYFKRNFLSGGIENYYLKSIFFGGGTPSLMDPIIVKGLIHFCKESFKLSNLDNNLEVTLEANPTSLEANKLKEFRLCGINRISIGIQSFDEKFLNFLGRNHNAYDGKKSIEMAKCYFNNVSFDLIYALPNQTPKDWEMSLYEAFQFEPDHLSLYQLTIEEGTAFNRMFKNGSLIPLDNDLASTMYSITEKITQKNQMPAYEISNYSKIDKYCNHNLTYWLGQDWIGIGPGASSRLFYKNKRTQIEVRKDPVSWLNSVKKYKNGIKQVTAETNKDYLTEKTMMGLRLVSGINVEETIPVLNMNKVKTMIDYNYLNIDNNIMKTTFEGRLKLNSILAEILK